MRKVELKMNEQEKYEEIKSLVDHGGNLTRAALRLGRSRATVYRMMDGYIKEGKEYFIHGNCGRKPSQARSAEERRQIVDLYNSKYWDASYALFSELLCLKEGITASPSLVRDILMNERILSPYARKKTKHLQNLELKRELKGAKIKSDRNRIETKIIAINDAHSRRSRCKYFGEMLQMDASLHNWFGDGKSTLHIAVDDATGMIVGGYFCEQETLKGYYRVLYSILTCYGVPYMFLTDRRTVFEYKALGTGNAEDDTFTQFGYACKQLGIDIKTSSVAQAKARVERTFGTLQRRLPVLFRMAGVDSLEQANTFLNSYIRKHNAKFALTADNIPSVFEKQPTKAKINLILSVLTERTIDAGHAISFMNKKYLTLNGGGNQIHFRKGTKGLVIKAFDDRLFFAVDECVCVLDEIPSHESVSPSFDNAPKPKPRKRYVPPMNHPWRTGKFESYRRRQPHVTTNPNRPAA